MDFGEVEIGTDVEREILEWGDFGIATRDLAQAVADSGFVPDIIIAIARGGLIPAGAISYALNIKGVGTLNVEFYTGMDETLPEPVVLPPMLDKSVLRGKRALVVDDVADSGKTLALVLEIARAEGCEARSAVLYAKSRSIVEPDYAWKHTDLWITFPWSADKVITVD